MCKSKSDQNRSVVDYSIFPNTCVTNRSESADEITINNMYSRSKQNKTKKTLLFISVQIIVQK